MPPPPPRGVARRLARLLISPEPDLRRRLHSLRFAAALDALLATRRFDAVVYESLEMAPYLGLARGRAGTVLDELNAEYLLQARAWRTDLADTRRWHAAAYSLVQAWKLRGWEAAMCRRADRVVAVSEADAAALRRLAGIEPAVVTNGVEIADYVAARAARWGVGTTGPVSGANPESSAGPRLGAATNRGSAAGGHETGKLNDEPRDLRQVGGAHGADAGGANAPVRAAARRVAERPNGEEDGTERLLFVGTLDFRPNVDAVTWFAREILPTIRARRPTVRFQIVGGPLAPAVAGLARVPSVELVGPVEDVRPYLAAAALYVVPMRIGGGVRLKVLEAAAAGVPLVTTRLGAEGVELPPGSVALADSAAEFAGATVELLERPGLARARAERALAAINPRYDWASIVPAFEAVLETLPARRQRAAP